MFESEASVATANGSKYISKLCRHFAHKVEVTFDEQNGNCALPTGPALMKATADSLTFQVSAETAENLTRAKLIIEDHFIRFSRKEGFEALQWRDEHA